MPKKTSLPVRTRRVEMASEDARLTHEYLDQIGYMTRPLRFERDAAGKVKAVVIPIDEFRQLLRQQRLLAWLVEGQLEEWEKEPTLPLEEVIARLKADGVLPA